MIRSIGVCGIELLCFCLSGSLAGAELDSGGTAIAQKYVRSALKYEAEGENDYRNIFLREARKAAPDFAPANWQSGRLEYDGLWRTVSEAQSRARQDDRLFFYIRKRDRCPDTAEGHGDLARWCRSQQLPDRARLHWYRVLHHSPRDTEAMSELGLRDVKGVLLTQKEIELRREQASQAKRIAKSWQAKLHAKMYTGRTISRSRTST